MRMMARNSESCRLFAIVSGVPLYMQKQHRLKEIHVINASAGFAKLIDHPISPDS